MIRGRFVAAAGAASLALAVLPAVGAHAGLDPVPPGFRATQVSAISSTNWWVLGSVPGCGGHRCNAIAHTTNGGVSFSLEKTSAHTHGTPTKATTLRMSVDGVHGWVLAPGRALGFQLWRTSNAGWTWTRVPLAPRLSVLDVGGGKVWVAGREGSRARAWSASANATSASAFTRRLDVPTVAVAGSPALVAQSGGRALVLNFRPSDNRSRAYVVGSSGFTAHNGPSWCDFSLGYGQISSSHGTTWLDCPTGTADAYGYSTGRRDSLARRAGGERRRDPLCPRCHRRRPCRGLRPGSARSAARVDLGPRQRRAQPGPAERDDVRVHRLHQPVRGLRGDRRRQAPGLERRRHPLARPAHLTPVLTG